MAANVADSPLRKTFAAAKEIPEGLSVGWGIALRAVYCFLMVSALVRDGVNCWAFDRPALPSAHFWLATCRASRPPCRRITPP